MKFHFFYFQMLSRLVFVLLLHYCFSLLLVVSFVFFIFVLTLFYLIVVVVVVAHKIPLLLTSRWLSRLVLFVLWLHYCFFIVAHLFLLFFTIECNQMIGSHAGVLLGSSQPSIQVHLSTATNIAAKANVGETAERNHLSNIVTGNLQCYTSCQGLMLDSFIEVGRSNTELSHFSMLVDHNLVPDGPNGQLDPYFIKLIVQSPTGSLGKECKSFMNCYLVNWFWLSMFGDDGNSPYQPSTVMTNFHTLFVTLHLNYGICFTMKEFTGFPGCLDAVTKEFWWSQEMIDTTFGACPNHKYCRRHRDCEGLSLQ